MHKCCCEQNPSSKMTSKEEETWWNAKFWEANCKQGECTGAEGDEEDDEKSADVKWKVVVTASATT